MCALCPDLPHILLIIPRRAHPSCPLSSPLACTVLVRLAIVPSNWPWIQRCSWSPTLSEWNFDFLEFIHLFDWMVLWGKDVSKEVWWGCLSEVNSQHWFTMWVWFTNTSPRIQRDTWLRTSYNSPMILDLWWRIHREEDTWTEWYNKKYMFGLHPWFLAQSP